MYFYIPQNIDVSSVIEFSKETDSTLNKDKMTVILYEIVRAEENKMGYREIPSVKLQSLVHDYKQYLDALYSQGIIEVDWTFQYGEDVPSKVRGYKFSEKCDTVVKEVEITNLPLIKKYRRNDHLSTDYKNRLPHLTKWFNNMLIVEVDTAISFIKTEYDSNLPLWKERENIRKSWFPDFKQKKQMLDSMIINNPVKRYNHAYMAIKRLSRDEYRFYRDDTSFRVHTDLVRIPKSVRRFVKYNEQPLVAVDIKSSQPYFSLLLLDKSFYNNIYLYNKGRFTLSPTTHIILEETLEKIDKEEIARFEALILSGKFYEYFQSELVRFDKVFQNYTRDKIKDLVFGLLYSRDRNPFRTDTPHKNVFNERFPGIYDLHSKIQSVQRNLLPILLQRIESYAIIDTIATRIGKEFPDMPIFTIHDSLATTEKNADVVHRIMEEELTMIVGHKPRLTFELWE